MNGISLLHILVGSWRRYIGILVIAEVTVVVVTVVSGDLSGG